ncbi:MAG: DUF177 domain-containing protein [Thermomicrobiales bacterium]|nr:DUF177 domain-containing protein [Thermomicrobiales bacterium]
MQLKNDTRINVAQLMKEDVGAYRVYDVSLDWFALDQDMMARDVTAHVRLTRIGDGLLATGSVAGTAIIECVRCLEMYDQPFAAEFDHDYRPSIDVRSGAPVAHMVPAEEVGTIDESHELDLTEPFRQVALLDLPIKPICREDCPGLGQGGDDDSEVGDLRFRILGDLLDEDETSEQN